MNDRPLRVKECYSVTEATNCHILFICTSEQERLPEIFDGLRNTLCLQWAKRLISSKPAA